MPRSNVTAKQKLDAVKKILSGEESRRHIRQIYGVAHSSVEEWILKYQIKGEKAFSDKFQKVEYSKEIKDAAVKAYLNGDGSQNEICRIYGLNSRSPLEQWIKEYNSNKELKPSKSIGGTIMTKNKKTSFEERVEIAQYCIKFGHSYSEAAEKYNVSYTQARSYALKYKESGKDALKDKRGKRKSEDQLTEVEHLRREIKRLENEKIANIVEKIHDDYPDKGYRRIRDDLYRYYNINVNDKRILRICRVLQIKSTIKYKNNVCTIQNQHPTYTTENILNRNFKADAPDEKWLTDVSEFHYYVNGEKHRLYLSAILDLYDRRIVAYTIGDSNNTELVYNMFDFAVKNNPKAHPIFHSDRGYQ